MIPGNLNFFLILSGPISRLPNRFQQVESSGAYKRDAELVPENRGDGGAEGLNGVQHFLVRKGRNTHLECDAGDAAENFIHIKDLFRDRFSVADQQRAGRSALGVKFCTCGGGPAAVLADFGKGVRIAWKKYFRGFVSGVCQKANGGNTYKQPPKPKTAPARRFPSKVYCRAEAIRP